MIDLAPANPYGLTLRIPVLAAAGCFGYGIEYGRLLNIGRIGAIITRTTTLRPRRPARRPQIVETPAGLLSVGPWPNPGLRYVLDHYAPQWAGWDTPVILSVAGETPTEYSQIAAALEGVAGVAGLELNLASDIARATMLTAAVRAATALPLLIKLPALEEGLADLALAVAQAGADALTLTAPLPAIEIDPISGARLEGELSGPALRPIALRAVAEVATALDLPLIGCGGIATTEDAQRFFTAGARAVQIGAALLADPFAAIRIGAELAAR